MVWQLGFKWMPRGLSDCSDQKKLIQKHRLSFRTIPSCCHFLLSASSALGHLLRQVQTATCHRIPRLLSKVHSRMLGSPRFALRPSNKSINMDDVRNLFVLDAGPLSADPTCAVVHHGSVTIQARVSESNVHAQHARRQPQSSSMRAMPSAKLALASGATGSGPM